MALPARYKWRNFKRVLSNPRMSRGELEALCESVDGPLLERRHPVSGGISVVARDWDILVILDACRYDTFQRRCDADGDMSPAVSRGTESRQFLRRNFAGEVLHDTVYVTANPHERELPVDTFHTIDRVYVDGWDEDAGTVLPETVTERALAAADRYPNKRLVIHYMQPHAPYVGPAGEEVAHNPSNDPSAAVRSVWANLRYGLTDVTIEAVRRAYRENLDLAVEAALTCDEAIAGKTVVTADHGELLGDRLWPIPVRGYGHPPGLRAPGLIQVPWFEPPYEERRETFADPPSKLHSPSDQVVERRLADLGYI